MKEPSLEVMDRVRGTILDFLTREDFLPLLTIFLTSQTVQGYGYLDEVICIYFLLLTSVTPGVSNIWLDLDHAQVCGKHIATNYQTRHTPLQCVCPQARL